MQDRDTVATTVALERPLALQLALEVGLAAVFTVAIAAAAHLKLPLPFTPVPLTTQTLVVLLAGAMLGPRVGFAAVTGYLLLTLLGLPVMAGPSFAGVTGGYVLGFVLAAVLAGYAARQKGWAWLAAGMTAGSLIILVCGSLWLSAYTGQDMKQAFTLGMVPFLAGDALKTAAAVGLVKVFRPKMQRLLG